MAVLKYLFDVRVYIIVGFEFHVCECRFCLFNFCVFVWADFVDLGMRRGLKWGFFFSRQCLMIVR